MRDSRKWGRPAQEPSREAPRTIPSADLVHVRTFRAGPATRPIRRGAPAHPAVTAKRGRWTEIFREASPTDRQPEGRPRAALATAAEGRRRERSVDRPRPGQPSRGAAVGPLTLRYVGLP